MKEMSIALPAGWNIHPAAFFISQKIINEKFRDII